jgi:hypothetical protein
MKLANTLADKMVAVPAPVTTPTKAAFTCVTIVVVSLMPLEYAERK